MCIEAIWPVTETSKAESAMHELHATAVQLGQMSKDQKAMLGVALQVL